MRAVVVYESMYGNTHAVADAVAAGLRPTMDVIVVPVGTADSLLATVHGPVDLLVVGGPTHAWSMSRPSTRHGAVKAAAQPDTDLHAEPGAEGLGLREWIETTPCRPLRVAAFDTHMQAPLGLSGSAAKHYLQRLRHHGHAPAAGPEQFLVTKQNTLVDGELERARQWGVGLAVTVQSATHA